MISGFESWAKRPDTTYSQCNRNQIQLTAVYPYETI
jgi:hypothetical protein